MKFIGILFLLFFACVSIENSYSSSIESALIQGENYIEITFSASPDRQLASALSITPDITVKNFTIDDRTIQIVTNETLKLSEHYYLHWNNGKKFLVPYGILDSLYSDKDLGYTISDQGIIFRLFAPRAKWVRLVIYNAFEDERGSEYQMIRDNQGVWEFQLSQDFIGKSYGYRLWGPQGNGELFDSTIVVADPYSLAVATLNHYTHPAKTLILEEDNFNWENGGWISQSWKDLIIYEMHIRDLTAHSSSGLPLEDRGFYTSLLKPDQKGGLPYIKNLGVNAVELLPAQDFGNLEIPYKDENAPVYNTWNPYAKNHWGYMTSYFFAPESYYAYGNFLTEGQICGSDGRQIREFKTMVKAFHENEIAVLMDVVYNHVSQYDYNPLKYIDKFYYFRLEEDCSFTSVSGCGNDLKTERPMARRLIVDSVIHWMQEYQVDGFRFDLAKLIDWKTIDAIREAALQVNPGVILIAEPWGGGYDPSGFSDHGWAAWNDQIRNGVKGQNPDEGLGFIFGAWQGENNTNSLRRYITGSLRKDGGQFNKSAHSVNYLESHDDHTMGDFIRLGLKDVSENQIIKNLKKHNTLSTEQLKLNKLAALFLFTSQGPIMIHEGQEYARSKVIAPTSAPDPDIGKIDHNSYNKDNETNWLNFALAEANQSLIDYYRGLIKFRKAHPVFRHAAPSDYQFFDTPDSLLVGFQLHGAESQYLVYLNGSRTNTQKVTLPAGKWGVLVDGSRAGAESFRRIRINELDILPGNGMVLVKQ